jgi:uncharacterized membrane protein YkvA (DUF1232 family)
VRARQLTVQTYTQYLAYRHPGTPCYVKIFVALVVRYVFSPIDLIPDFVPAVGLLDEMVVIYLGIISMVCNRSTTYTPQQKEADPRRDPPPSFVLML